MSQSSLYFSTKQKIYLKSEPDYQKRLAIVNELLATMPEEFDIDCPNAVKRAANQKRLDFLGYYLSYDAYDEFLLSIKQQKYIEYREFSTDFF